MITQVETVTDDTFEYVVDLQNKNRNSVGFLPFEALRQYQKVGRLWLERENDEPCGYLAISRWTGRVTNRSPEELRVIQTCIQYDARRTEHGRSLVERAIELAVRSNLAAVTCWCASDLDANQFWAAMGFRRDGTRMAGRRRRRGATHIHWRYEILPSLF